MWMYGVIAVWLVALSVPLVQWMAPHTLPLRQQPSAPGVHTWVAVHSLRPDCACSAAVMAHLLTRGAQPGWQEQIELSDPGWKKELEGAGFTVRVAPVPSGPRLGLYSPDGAVWRGGYAARRPRTGMPLADLDLMTEFRAGRMPGAMATYGCTGSI